MESQVLEQDQLSGTQLADGVVDPRPQRVAGHAHLVTEQLGQPIGDRLEAQRVVDLALGPAQVAGQDHAGAALQQVADRGQAGADAGVVGDPTVVERDVQVRAQEDALAGDVDVTNRLLVERGIWSATHSRAAM